jgi:hypothetical protein
MPKIRAMRTVLFIAILGALGCGKKEEAKKESAPAPAPEKKPEEAKPAPEAPKPTPPAATDAIDPADSCTVKVSGAYTGEASRKGGSMAVASRYWMSDDEKKVMGEMPAFTINCDGKDAAGEDLNVHLIAPADDTIKRGPGKYTVGGKSGTINRLVTVRHSPIKAEGEIDITEFDGNHLKGTFKLSGDNLKKEVFNFEGTFDLKCHGSKCG